MATMSQKLGTACFGAFLVLAIVSGYLCCVVLQGLKSIGILSRQTMEKIAMMCIKYTWMSAVKSAVWIRTWDSRILTPSAWKQFLAEIDAADAAYDAAVKAGDKDAKRTRFFIMSNHLSFLDTLMIVVYTPPRVLVRIRCYMGAHLFKLPLFATICKTLGHFPVYFAKSEDGKFSLDQKRMEGVELEVMRHLDEGGILSLFPEGAMNTAPVPDKLQTFRYGTFKRALAEDARVWHFVMSGHQTIWPCKAPIGGNPGATGSAFYCLTPKGARATLAEIKNISPVSCETSSTDDFVILAEHAKQVMQKQYTALQREVAARSVGVKRTKAA